MGRNDLTKYRVGEGKDGITCAGDGITCVGEGKDGITCAGDGITCAGDGITCTGDGITCTGDGITCAGDGITCAGDGMIIIIFTVIQNTYLVGTIHDSYSQYKHTDQYITYHERLPKIIVR